MFADRHFRETFLVSKHETGDGVLLALYQLHLAYTCALEIISCNLHVVCVQRGAPPSVYEGAPARLSNLAPQPNTCRRLLTDVSNVNPSS